MAKNQGQTRGQRARNAPDAGSTARTRAAPARPAPEYKEPRSVRATARGYADGMIREEGEVFATNAPKGSWMEELGKKGQSKRERAVDDTHASMSDDPDLTTFSLEALQAKALDLGLTDASGLSKEDLIQAIQSAHDEDRAR